MILAFLATRAGKFAALALAVVLAVAAFTWWLSNERQEAVEADRAKAAVEVLGKARRADEASSATTTAIQSKVETTNAEVREAARNSDDPLRDGLDRLRTGKARPSPATR